LKEAAELSRASGKKVYEMCLAGKLRCVRIGRHIRIPIDAIERYEANGYPSLRRRLEQTP
jgi:excisionase family DNA binding protein